MASLGKIINSFLNATNENTVALANLNFDFALIKYEAPKEFQMVGTNLSSRRRDEAEDGKTHKIAGRLGALFKSIVPPTPNLINAYGQRTSQIAETPNVNPKNNPRYGPFAEFVGIDGTSLWAAATSAELKAGRHAPLAMHLLACILARRWEPAVAVSIWVELVFNRQQEIEASIQDEPQHFSLFMAGRQEISRDDLACWDASARAWLQSADEAKSVEKTKLDLIARNISVDIGSGQQTYRNVIEVWQSAMQGMENLVQGIPQQLSDGAVLVALSAWHLYPDLIVLGKVTKKVTFQDPLISPGGTVTVGLQFAHDTQEPGMHWSLTLSHLRYYQQDVKVNARSDMSRISMDELLVVAFGSLMGSWGVSSADYDDAAQILLWIRSQLLGPVETSVAARAYDPGWLRIVVLCGQKFLELTQQNRDLCSQLAAWGRRRAKGFLAFEKSLPFFGLVNPCLLPALMGASAHEAAIIYFRELAGTSRATPATFVIRYREVREDTTFFEFATVIPHERRSSKRELDGSLRVEHVYQRWLHLTRKSKSMFEKSRCFCTLCDSLCPCRNKGDMLCDDACHPLPPQQCQGLTPSDANRPTEVRALGEECQWVGRRDIYLNNRVTDTPDTFIWRNPPFMLRSERSTAISTLSRCPSLDNGFQRCTCAEPCFHESTGGGDEILFERFGGNPATYCLFRALELRSYSKENLPKAKMLNEVSASKLKESLSMLKSKRLTRKVLEGYLQCYDSTLALSNRTYDPTISSDETSRKLMSLPTLLHTDDLMSQAQRIALTALDFAQRTYEQLDGAFIPLSITNSSLDTVRWVDSKVSISSVKSVYDDDAVVLEQALQDEETSRRVSVARAFACIVFFESGVYNVTADDCLPVMAVASGNSVFVARYLMSDPVSLLDNEQGYIIQRVTGNVGMVGISMLVPPQLTPHVRPLANDLRIVPHIPFDGQEEDNFAATTLHLRFTNWRRPYSTESRGTIDEGLFYVESVVSAHDCGKWVCDLDVHNVWAKAMKCLWQPKCTCTGNGDSTHTVSIDSWEELLDPPDGVGIVRAKQNWPARLAALALRLQLGHGSETQVLPPDTKICKNCVAAVFTTTTGSIYGVLIN